MTQKPSNRPPREPETHTHPAHPQRALAWVIAGVGTGLEAAALMVLAGLSAFGVVSGSASTTSRALTEAVMLLVLAVGVGLLARSMFQRKSLAKTPTLLWNFMLFPVGYSLMTQGAPLWGAITIVLAVVTFAAALLVPRYDLEAEVDDTIS